MVIGAGLAGLCAAHRLGRGGRPVTVVEASGRLGGQIHTLVTGDALVELGAEGFVARSVAVPQVCAEVGLDAQVIGQSTTLTYAATENGLVALEPGEAARLLGFQVPAEELGRGIRSLLGGMGSLVEALAESAVTNGVEVLTNCRASTVAPAAAGLEVHLGDRRHLTASAVVFAAPARAAAQVLCELAGPAATALASAPTTSNLSVSLVYERAHVLHPLDASGVVLPAATRATGARACTFVSSKFAGRAREGVAQLRVFFRPSTGQLDAHTDDDWAERAHRVVDELVGTAGAPTAAWVSRWPDALPAHTEDHRQKVAGLEEVLAPRAVVLAGSAFHGAGIDAAVQSGLQAATVLGPHR